MDVTVSLKDINAKAAKLQKEFDEISAIYDTVEDEDEKKVLKSRMQSKVYQKKYQELVSVEKTSKYKMNSLTIHDVMRYIYSIT